MISDSEIIQMQKILVKYIRHFREDNMQHSVYKAMAEYANIKVEEYIKLRDESIEENPRRQA